MATNVEAMAVIDHSINSLFIYDIDSNFNSEEIEDYLRERGHKLSNCSWGVFDGIVEDQREV